LFKSSIANTLNAVSTGRFLTVKYPQRSVLAAALGRVLKIAESEGSVWNNTVIPVIGNIVEALYTLPETNSESIYSPVEKLCTNGGNLFPSLLSLTALPNDKE
jgi:hypothetical protein